MKNIIIIVLMLMLPSLAMAQGQVTRKPKPNLVKPTHKHSVYGPKDCKECNRLRSHTHSVSGPEWCKKCDDLRDEQIERERKETEEQLLEEQRIAEERRKEQERIAEQQRLEEQQCREEEQRLAEERKRKEEEETRLAEQKRIIDNLVNNMVYVSGGTFTMGATPEQGSDAFIDEEPTHRVTLSSYYIGKYEVTQAEWRAVMGSNPSEFKGDNLPVENVSWNDCQEFIRKLNFLTGKNFRLPTEAEWEFAARGGNKSRCYKYSGSNDIGSVAWYVDNSGRKTHPVGQKSPNKLGLYDMTGNVWEWCQDWSGDYPSSAQTNPTGPASGSYRVNRGSCLYADAWISHVSIRGGDEPDKRYGSLGLRLVL